MLDFFYDTISGFKFKDKIIYYGQNLAVKNVSDKIIRRICMRVIMHE